MLRVSVEGREEPLASAVLLADEKRTAEFDIGQPARGSAEGASGSGHRAPGADPAGGARAAAPGDSTPGSASGDGPPRGVIAFLPLGIQHILEGWDHLLFLLALVLPGGSLGNLIRIVTAFTIAHSLTLAAAALELISVPAAPVEALIALSIAWVAAENLARLRPMSRRWAVAFAFGLIHGFGFSNVLRDIGLPRDALLSSLMWFNLGIELGQLLVVLLLVPALAWLGRLRLGKPVPQALSALILVAGVVLLVQRL
ncbi:MAG: HupE/UreJ family protein [Lautropia sp.]|nr:HupE/UreJ family protein [Lautropia sp.]